MSLADAQALGADMFFGEKYLPAAVRVVRVDGISKELCGGTHVAATGQIGSFRITGESSIGAGLRRIEAVTGEAAEDLVAGRLESLHAAAQLLGSPEDQVAGRIEGLLARLREAEKGARSPKATDAGSALDAGAALAGAQTAGDTKVIVAHFGDADAGALRRLADDLRASTGRFVAVLSGGRGGPSLLVAASRDLVGEGFDAALIVRHAAPLIGGGGGGRPDLAQAGGRDASRLDEALQQAARLSLEALQLIENG
jgi:alanyl-tRNA synthetase